MRLTDVALIVPANDCFLFIYFIFLFFRYTYDRIYFSDPFWPSSVPDSVRGKAFTKYSLVEVAASSIVHCKHSRCQIDDRL
jgi:hypothetical protein